MTHLDSQSLTCNLNSISFLKASSSVFLSSFVIPNLAVFQPFFSLLSLSSSRKQDYTQVSFMLFCNVSKKKFLKASTICDALRDLVPFVQFKKNVKNTHGRVLILAKLQASKINTPPWVLFTFFKLYKWYQIAQRTTYYQLSQSQNLSSRKTQRY